MSNTKQTAVEWLYDQIIIFPETNDDLAHNARSFQQAKAMEKEQIIDAYLELMYDEYAYEVAPKGWIDNAEQYYNETYEK